MNQQNLESFPPASPFDRVKAAAVRIVASGMLTSLAACTGVAEEREPLDPTAPTTVASSIAPSPAPVYEQTGVCNPSALASGIPRERQAAAEHCVRVMDSGRIALVTVGSTDALELTAGGIERAVRRASEGMVNVEVDVVYATNEVAAAFNEALGEEGCIDTEEKSEEGKIVHSTEEWLSVIADKLMKRELAGYDAILGVSKFRSCDSPGTAGLAMRGTGYAEVFGFDPLAPAGELSTAIVVVVHEIFHLYALGHSGYVEHPDGFSINPGEEMDLLAHLKNASYREYASAYDQDVMGYPADNLGVSLNAIHLDNLARIRSNVEDDTVLLSQYTNGQRLSFTAQDAQANRFARAHLTTPIELIDKESHKHDLRREFNGLAVVPRAGRDGRLHEADIYLTSADRSVAHIGLVPALAVGEEAQLTFVIGRDKLVIEIDSSGMHIRKINTQAYSECTGAA